MSEVRAPYPGLRAYQRTESDLFFGRDGCVEEMLERLAAQNFLAVLGASGSGKSSLVRTGLIDALQGGMSAAGPYWTIAETHPGTAPMRGLAAALVGTLHTDDTSFEIGATEAFVRRGPRSLIEWLDDAGLPERENVLVVVDQFEELFRYGDYASREEAEAFAALLIESATSPRIHVVLTMRSEYLGACALIPGLAEVINRSIYLTRRMTRDECREAIVGPAAVIGFDIEARLVTRLLNDMSRFAPWDGDRTGSQLQRLSRQADQLPLMQHALNRLWYASREGLPAGARPLLRLADYVALGRLEGALDLHARRVTALLSTEAQAAVPRIFRALVAGTALADAVRRPLALQYLVAIVAAKRTTVLEAVDAFRAADCNFLRPPTGAPLDNDAVVDISHESLIRQWASLAEWFEEEASAVATWHRLLDAEAVYTAGRGELLAGLDLQNADAWWVQEAPNPGWAAVNGGRFAEVAAFIEESHAADRRRDEAERRRVRTERRKLKIRQRIYGTFAIIFLISTLFSVWLYGEASAARDKAAEAQATAEAAQKTASDTLSQLRTANLRAVEAADTFVVGSIERLLATPGVAVEGVRDQLEKGSIFINQMARSVDPARIALTRARYAVLNAYIALRSADDEAALQITSNAAAKLFAEAGTSTPADEAATAISRLDGIAAAALINLGRLPEARRRAESGVEILLSRPPRTSDPLDLARAYQSRASVSGGPAAQDYGRGDAERCLELLETIRNRPPPRDRPVSASAENLSLESTCHYWVWAAALAGGDLPIAQAAAERSMAALAAIPTDALTPDFRIAGATMLTNIAAERLSNGDGGGDDLLEQARELIELSDLDLIQDARLRAAYVRVFGLLAELARRYDDPDGSIGLYENAIAAGTMDGRWRISPTLGEWLEGALAGQIAAYDDMGWSDDPRILRQFIAASERLIAIRTELLRRGWGSACRECILSDKRWLFAALARSLTVAGEDRFDDAVALAREIATEAEAILADPATSGESAMSARQSWFWTLDELDLPIHALGDAGANQSRIVQIQTVIPLLQAFVARFPQSRSSSAKLGMMESAFAETAAMEGQPADALAAAARGAALHDRRAFELLAKWYASGSGPVAADPTIAARYQAVLDGRNWATLRVSVPMDRLQTPEVDAVAYELELSDPWGATDDWWEATAWQLEALEGMRLSEDVRTHFERLQLQAGAENHSFVALVASVMDERDVEEGGLAVHLGASLAAGDAAATAAGLVQAWDDGDGADAVTAALAELVRRDVGASPHSDALVDVLLEALAGDAIAAAPELAVTVVDSVLQHAPSSGVSRVVALFTQRSRASALLEDASAQESDLAAALALAPHDPDLLVALGTLWAGDGRVNAAINLLERAADIRPEDSAIGDSLGWAYVQSGKLERGLQVLESARVAAPADAGIALHLADAYRRLSRYEEAEATLVQVDSLARSGQQMLDAAALRRLIDAGPPLASAKAGPAR